MRAGLTTGLVITSMLLADCRRETAAKSEVTVAAAANLTDVFQRLGPQFEAQTGIRPIFSFASTAQLTQQIANGAPFDVFTAADAEHVQYLDRKGLVASGSRVVYATGILALWIPPRSQSSAAGILDLGKPDVRAIAIAKPELAPYGKAAVDSLKALGIWDAVEPKVVYTESISLAKQYGASNNADAVFTAYSLVLNAGGKAILIDESLHEPITQELGIVAQTVHPDAARKFVAFLLTGPGHDLLRNSGYR